MGKFKIGDIVKYSFCPESRVVGIDHYKLYSFSGKRKIWTSFTLVSDSEKKFARWWITDEEDGLLYWANTTTESVHGELDFNESGLCLLDAKGDTIESSPYSSQMFFRAKDKFYCLEVFESENLVLAMEGHKI
jgi:hypothetical protein